MHGYLLPLSHIPLWHGGLLSLEKMLPLSFTHVDGAV